MSLGNVLISVSAANVLYPVLFAVFCVAALAVFIWLMVKTAGQTQTKTVAGVEGSSKIVNYTALLLVMLVIGLVLRLIFVFAVKGFRSDVNTIVSLFEHMKNNGFADNYYSARGMGVFPLTYYIYAFMGMFANLLGLNTDSLLMPLFVKLPLIAADLVSAFILYKLAAKYMNQAAATVTAGFVCVFPLFVFASGVWATQYSLLAMFLLLSIYFLADKNFIGTVGCYGAALLVHKDAVYLFPMFAVFVVYGLVKASVTLHKARKEKVVSFESVLSDSSLRPVFTVPVSIAGTLILSYLVSLPLMIGSFGAGFFTFMYRVYFAPLASFSSFGHNSLGIFNLFMRNGEQFGHNFPTVIFTVLFAVIITGIVLLVYLSKKNRANLVFLGGYIVLTLATYFVGFTEFGLLASVALFLVSFLLVRDKRIITVFGMLSLLITVNAATVMAYANYFNNLTDYNFTSAVGYTGSEILSGGISAVNIVCSALAVLTHLYATVVLLDISMSNKRKVLPYDSNIGFGRAMAEFFSIKKK